MKNLKITTLALVAILAFSSCTKDDTPLVNEEEVITTVITKLTETNGTNVITLTSRDLDGDDGPDAPVITTSIDLDGDGPNAPEITVSGNLTANTEYTGTVTILNEIESQDITSVVEEEGEEHQLFFQALTNSIGTFAYTDKDKNDKPIGLKFTLSTGDATSGNLRVTLRHLPNKSADGVANGNITEAGGATDFAVTYPVTVK
jgi:hypothetical protein